jgi:Protein of unknown function (DUF1566)
MHPPTKRIIKSSTAFRVTCTILLVAGMRLHAAGLNDTGQTDCFNATNDRVACSAQVGGDRGVNPRQDGRYGRDAAARNGAIAKIGGGAGGFDFTKIGNDGSTLVASAPLGASATQWACTKDNVTGLTWEVKSTSGLRALNHRYSWYSTNSATNGGDAGLLGSDTCGGSLAAAPFNNQCNTQHYAAAVNAAGLCGARDWRVPTRRELLSIMNVSQAYSIDQTYFPNSAKGVQYWTISTVAQSPEMAWTVDFADGVFSGFSIGYSFRRVKADFILPVRLVRGVAQ